MSQKPDFQKQATILIIDDNPVNLGVIADYLEEYDFEIMTARNGEKGLEKARMGQPGLILLDVMLPGIDGFETCRRLKADKLTREIPVIFMTVLTGVEDQLKGFDAGGVDYIPKPFQREIMLTRVKTHLKLQDQKKQLQYQKIE